MADEDAATPVTFHQHTHAATPEEREAAFGVMLQRTVPYYEKVAADGDLAWFAKGDPRHAAVAAKLGQPEDTTELDLRRSLFMRRYERPAPPQGLTLDINRIRGIKPDPPATPTALENAA